MGSFFCRSLILGIALLWNAFVSPAQNSFVTAIASTKDETPGKFIQNSEGQFVGIVYITNPSTLVDESYIYGLNENGDTIRSQKVDYPGKSIFIQNIIQASSDPTQYIITGWARSEVSYYDTLTYISKLDSNFQPLWENLYDLVPNGVYAYAEFYQNLLQKSDSGYLFATNYDNPGDHRLVLFEFSDQGDSLSNTIFAGDSAGIDLWSLTYNHDTTAFYLFTYRAHYVPFQGDCQRITLDFNLNQIDVQYYPRWFESGISPCVMPDGNIITGGLYENMEPPKYSHMAAFKHDNSFNLIGECFIADPDYDIRKNNGRISLDYYYPNSIFLAGTFDWDVGIWREHPSWIVIGKMDSDLNLFKETYVGGDAFYQFHTLIATSDGGVFLSASRYDFTTQDHERDAYLIKLDSIDVSVNIGEVQCTSNIIKVFPNPADEYLTVEAVVANGNFVIYDLSGKILLKHFMSDMKETIPITGITSGIYLWSFQYKNTIFDKGKLIVK